MRKLWLSCITALATGALVLGWGSPASSGFIGTAEISPTSGPPGTTVTVTVTNCGEQIAKDSAYVPGSGQVIVTIAGWGEPFESGFEGGVNDATGVATATFQVPNVAAGTYEVTIECVNLVPLSRPMGAKSASAAQPASFGAYPPGSFTVTAAASSGGTTAGAATSIQAQANTTG